MPKHLHALTSFCSASHVIIMLRSHITCDARQPWMACIESCHHVAVTHLWQFAPGEFEACLKL